MNKCRFILLMTSAMLFLLVACGNTKNKKNTDKAETQRIKIPVFSADSAYKYVEEQLAFGARVPGSEAHNKCLKYFETQFKRFGANVEIQKGHGTLYNGTKTDLYNVIAKVNPEAKRRVIVCAHWDCRPWADEDIDEKNHQSAVLGANDGASGVAVIMEMCRIMNHILPNIGVDFILFDLEDSGTPSFYKGKEASQDTWCLGSQYWARTLRKTSDSPMYGILLDMVGAPDAKFFKEGISMHFAPHIVNKVWGKAEEIGYNDFFIPHNGGAITDDHLYINTLANIPCINIIQHNPNTETGFGEYWHTVNDNIRNINKNTLMVVGKTVMEVIYNE